MRVLQDAGERLRCLIDGKEVWVPIAAMRQHSEVWTAGDRGTLIVARWFAVRAGLVAGAERAQPEPPRFDFGIRDVLQLGPETEARWLVDLTCGCSLFVSEGRAPWRAVSLTPV